MNSKIRIQRNNIIEILNTSKLKEKMKRTLEKTNYYKSKVCRKRDEVFPKNEGLVLKDAEHYGMIEIKDER